MTKPSPFRYFKTSPELIRLAVMMYVCNRPDPGLNLALRQMTVTNQMAAARPIGLIGMGHEKRIQLGLNRLRDKIPRALPQQIRQRIGRNSFWRAKRDNRILRHVVYPFLCENCGA
jgi:hypothetical protein